MRLVYLSVAARMLGRRLRISFFGVKRYKGSSEQICRSIIGSCFDKKKGYFMVSSGHFREFYCRDFGLCAKSLVQLGYVSEVRSTLAYALEKFERHGSVEQSISPGGIPFTFPEAYSPDALAFLVHALDVSGNKSLAEKHRKFLESEARVFARNVIEPKTGHIKRGVHFSSIKDHSIRDASCYDACMAGMLSSGLSNLGLANPLGKFNYKDILMRVYWNGKFFYEDAKRVGSVSGDANVFPFWCGIVEDRNVLAECVKSIRAAGLDKPIPLKYTVGKPDTPLVWYERFAQGYEYDAVWGHLGLAYIQVVEPLDKRLARGYAELYEQKIALHKNFLEVYNPDGSPFKTAFYYADDSMVWCANFLGLKKKI